MTNKMTIEPMAFLKFGFTTRGGNFKIFGQYFAPTLVMSWKLQAYRKCWFDSILSLSISISWKVLTEDAESVGFFKMLLMKWHENKSCLIRFDCSHIENQGRKIINFFGISRIQIRTKIRLDHKDLSWTTFWWLDADRTLDF